LPIEMQKSDLPPNYCFVAGKLALRADSSQRPLHGT
jgi:hypothetical protein